MLDFFKDLPEGLRSFAEWVGANPGAATAWAVIGGILIVGLTFFAGRFKGKPPVPAGSYTVRASSTPAGSNTSGAEGKGDNPARAQRG